MGGGFFCPFCPLGQGGYVECPRLSTRGGEGVKIGPRSCWMPPNYADIVGSEKVEICAGVMYGRSLVQTTALSKNQLRLKQMGIKKIKQVTSLVMFWVFPRDLTRNVFTS